MESKIWCFRVRAFLEYLMMGQWLVSFSSSPFLSPHQSSSDLFLSSSPIDTMSSTPFTITIPTSFLQYEEVWGMDNKDFYDGSDALVCMVKCSWICHELNLTL